MTWLALDEMTFHSTLKEPLEPLNIPMERLSNAGEPLNAPRCCSILFRYSSAVNGYVIITRGLGQMQPTAVSSTNRVIATGTGTQQ